MMDSGSTNESPQRSKLEPLLAGEEDPKEVVVAYHAHGAARQLQQQQQLRLQQPPPSPPPPPATNEAQAAALQQQEQPRRNNVLSASETNNNNGRIDDLQLFTVMTDNDGNDGGDGGGEGEGGYVAVDTTYGHNDYNYYYDGDEEVQQGQMTMMAEDMEEEEEILPQLPPLTSYWCSYITYFFAFSKWIILCIAVNVTVFVIVSIKSTNSGNIFGYGHILPFYNLQYGCLLGVMWILTAIWLYYCSKSVDLQVQRYDLRIDYEHVLMLDTTTTNNNNGGGSSNRAAGTSSGGSFTPDYENIHGQVSRTLDSMFDRKSSPSHINNSHSRGTAGAAATGTSTSAGSSRTRTTTTTTTPTSGTGTTTTTGGGTTTSFLVNASYALSILCFSCGMYMITGTLLGQLYVEECKQHQVDTAVPPTSPITDDDDNYDIPHPHPNIHEYSHIDDYPSDVQDWIQERWDRNDYSVLRPSYDDDYWLYTTTNGNYYNNDDDGTAAGGDDDDKDKYYNFPTTYFAESGTFVVMDDGTFYFAGTSKSLLLRENPPPTDDDDEDEDHKHKNTVAKVILTEKIDINNNNPQDESIVYHEDYVNPHMFLPVEGTIKSTIDGVPRPTQACFVSSLRDENKDWGPQRRKTRLNCITQRTTGRTIETVLIEWKDRAFSDSKHHILMASTGDKVLVSFHGDDGKNKYQEVVQVTPKTMEVQSIYHRTIVKTDYEIEDYRYHYLGRCVQRKVHVVSAIVGVVVLLIGSAWLIVREGVSAGVVPLVYAIVAILASSTREHGQVPYVVFGVGFVIIHALLCFPKKTFQVIPSSWIQRDMYVVALYSWITSFILFDMFVWDTGTTVIECLFGFATTGLILDHPVVHLMGYLSILVGFVVLCLAVGDGWDFWDFLFSSLIPVLIGLGMISFANCFSRNRPYFKACGKSLAKGIRACFSGDGDASRRSVGV